MLKGEELEDTKEHNFCDCISGLVERPEGGANWEQ